MPEGPEVDLDHVQEHVHEAAAHEAEASREEHGRLGFMRMVALSTAFLAALAAVASLQAGATVNEALVLKTESNELQTRASDVWTYYQAKGIKAAVTSSTLASYAIAGKTPPPALTATMARLAGDQKQSSDSAHALERLRDERSAEAAHLLHRHHGFANAVALFQVAIALAAVTALTRSRPVYGASLVLGAAGVVLFALQLL